MYLVGHPFIWANWQDPYPQEEEMRTMNAGRFFILDLNEVCMTMGIATMDVLREYATLLSM